MKIVFLLLLLAGCGTFDVPKDAYLTEVVWHKVEGLDNLQVLPVVETSVEALQFICEDDSPRIIGCAAIDLPAWTCQIFVRDILDRGTIAHELHHCRGYEHKGNYSRIYTKYKESLNAGKI